MKREPIFTGVATALITPFKNVNEVDYDKFAELIDWQIDSGINALVICGTSGEASTLTDDEHVDVIKFACEQVKNRVPVIAGAGSNDTQYAIGLAEASNKAGADAILCVTPYYNKATQNGLVKMYKEIADASACPVIVYNVPSRTGVNIEPKTYALMADHPNICAIKEANGNLSKIVETMSLVGDKLDLYSGNDDQVVPLMSLGAKGVISVLSNVLPTKTVEMCNKYFAGDIKGACDLQLNMLPLINALFSEVNPIPVKAAMHAMGFCDGTIRSPLTEMEDAHLQVLLSEMKKQGIRI